MRTENTTGKWYSVWDSSVNETEPIDVMIHDIIGEWGYGDGVNARDFIKSMEPLKGRKINLHVNSPGGAVTDGIAIYNYLRQRGGVSGFVDGYAASIASLIVLGCETVTIASNAMMMVHAPSGIAFGTKEEIQNTADLLGSWQDLMSRTYVAETGSSRETVDQWMSKDTWFTPDEALEAGLVDNVYGEIQFTAHADLTRFNPPSKKSGPPNQQPSSMNPILAKIFGGSPEPTSRDKFNASVVASFGVTEEQIAAAEKEARPDFVAAVLTEKIKGLTESITAITTERDTAKASALAALAEVETLKATAKTVPQAAQELLAKSGVPAVPEETKNADKDEDDAAFTARYLAIPDAVKKSEFYANNKDRITSIARRG